MKLTRLAFAISLAALSASASVSLAADAYPSKAIKLVVGYPPGGPTDIAGRVIAQNLSRELGKPVVVENQGGAGGVIGASNVAKAKPDGYTLHVSVEASQTRGLALNASLPYDQLKDFTYIRKVARQRNLLVVNPSLPVSNVRELIAYLKERPGQVNTGGTFGSTSHIGGTLFDMLNGTKMTFINYPGGSQPIVDTIANTVQVGFFVEATVAQHIKSGKLKALAIAAARRSPAFPDLPTIVEAGGKPLDVSPWFGVAGPAKLPPEVVRIIGEALDRITASREFVSQLEGIGAEPINGTTSESFTKDVADGIVYWNKWAQDIKAPLAR
jgi:tripartite-type tricarboxylate transporter receptor subunit TctC